MKTIRNRIQSRRGFISLALVMSVGLVVVTSLAFAYKHHMRSLDAQAQTRSKP